MKKILLPLAIMALATNVNAQCEQPTILPYMENVQFVTVPALPECVASSYNTFSSSEVFESIAGPIPGFTNNVLAYDTTIDTQFGMPPSTYVSATLSLPPMELQQGIAYTLSFRYGNSTPELTISELHIYVNGINTAIGTLQKITGATSSVFVSQPFTAASTGIYNIVFDVGSVGTQGLLYLDDIVVEQSATMNVENTKLASSALYPNPVKDLLHIDYGQPIDKVEVFTVTGQQIYSAAPKLPSTSIHFNDLAGGLYIVKIQSGSNVGSYRILKNW